MAVDLPQPDVDRIVDILTEAAGSAKVDPERYFRDLVRRSGLPKRWEYQLAGWEGDPSVDARTLVTWALARDRNPAQPRLTTIGSVLTALLDDLGLDARATVVALIVSHNLYLDGDLIEALAARYQVPKPASEVQLGSSSAIQDFDWRGPEDELELQGLFSSDPSFFDVGFLKKAIERSAGVCRIEKPDGAPLGTGCLVAPDLVLTNYHVLEQSGANALEKAVTLLALRFGSVTAETGQEAKGQIFRLAPQDAVVESSPTGEHDFVLLRAEPGILDAENLEPVVYDDRQPVKGMGLNILQHPEGETMKVAFSSNGTTGVYPEAGLVQYVTRTAGGSSGSPCFDDDWSFVALHHAERSRAFGAVREGVLLSVIHEQIKAHL